MHHRNATIRRFTLALLVVWSFLITFSAHTTLRAGVSAQSEPLAQSHLLLLPLGDTAIELLTHTVDVAVSVDGDRSLRLDVAASYRFHNPKAAESTLLLQVNTPPPGAPAGLRLPQALALETGGQALSLQPTGNGLQQTAQLNFGPDARRTLLLRYSLLFATAELPAFVYPASVLDVWPGRIGSWRVTLNFADSGSGLLAPDNWLAAEPEGWTYNGSRLQWLSEDAFPQEPFRWQVIHPAIWQEIQTRRQTIRQQPGAADFRGLGDLYRRLYDTAGKEAGIEETDRERFYAQTLSAYSNGLSFAEQAGLPPQEKAALHQALAALYRSRSIEPDGGIDFAYVQLMAAEAEASLALLPAEATTDRSEVNGWLADGLRMQARQAQQRKDWPAALALLDRLAALPDSPVDPAQLAEDRRLLLLEQALQFLSQGNQEAALALAGSTLALDDLLPAAEQRTIFARWELTLTIRPDDLILSGAAPALPGREETARRLVDQLALAWGAVQPRSGVAQVHFDGVRALVTLSGVSLGDRLTLVQATPQNTQWALVRTLLVNANAEIETTAYLIWQRTTLRHSLDLRPVADQWSGIAASLERDSLTVDLSAATEDRIRGELRAVTHRQEAERWQKLVRDSRVQIELAASAQTEPASSRVWSVQPTDSPQPLGYVVETISPLRLLLAVVLAMAAIFALAGILWLLL
ncbi:MAG: hypothetical protein HY328_18235 [Chloroflexi bacterium]|nr:hypothetical protein [Chloroflexota bacterium]